MSPRMDESKELEFSVDKPLNREPPAKDLVDRYTQRASVWLYIPRYTNDDSFLTPSNISYDRNHGPIPYLSSGESHLVRIDGHVHNPITLSVQHLTTQLPQHEVICALECAGNRRHTMRTLLKEVEGIDWGDGAVMNCRWRGPRLRDVLERMASGVDLPDGRKMGDLHAAFSCYQVRCQNDEWFGGSVPLERVLGKEDGGDVILAVEVLLLLLFSFWDSL